MEKEIKKNTLLFINSAMLVVKITFYTSNVTWIWPWSILMYRIAMNISNHKIKYVKQRMYKYINLNF